MLPLVCSLGFAIGTASSTRNFYSLKGSHANVLRKGLGESRIHGLLGDTNLSSQQQEQLASLPSKDSRVITRSLP